MGIIYTLILGLLGAFVAARFRRAETGSDFFIRVHVVGAVGAFLGAWLAGSFFQQSSFITVAPGPITLLGALFGGFLGGLAISFVGDDEEDDEEYEDE